jgi:hypothetical protein
MKYHYLHSYSSTNLYLHYTYYSYYNSLMILSYLYPRLIYLLIHLILTLMHDYHLHMLLSMIFMMFINFISHDVISSLINYHITLSSFYHNAYLNYLNSHYLFSPSSFTTLVISLYLYLNLYYTIDSFYCIRHSSYQSIRI